MLVLRLRPRTDPEVRARHRAGARAGLIDVQSLPLGDVLAAVPGHREADTHSDR